MPQDTTKSRSGGSSRKERENQTPQEKGNPGCGGRGLGRGGGKGRRDGTGGGMGRGGGGKGGRRK